MKKLTSKHIWLIILGVAFFIVVYYQISNQALFGGKPVAAARPNQPKSASADNPVKYDVPALRIELLAHNSAMFDPAGRNLFNYDKPKPTAQELEAIRRAQEEAQRRAEEERKRRDEEAKRQAEIAQQQAAEQAHLPPPPPPAPPINFKFIGYLGPIEDKIAILEEGKDLYFGREGETVKEHFLIMKIDFDSVVVSYNKPEWQKQSKVLPLGK